MSELPTGWVQCSLGDMTTDCEHRVPESAERFTYIDIGSVGRQSKTVECAEEILGAKAPSRARKVVRTGDTLVSMTRPNLNAVALIDESLDSQIASTGFDVLRPILVDPRWIYYLVRSSNFVEAMCDLVQGALYPAVRTKDVRSFIAPLAPAEEQKRIADKLDILLARIENCCGRLDHVAAILRRFRQSVLSAAISGKLTEDWRGMNGVSAEWRRRPLSELIMGLEQGWSPKCENFPSKDSEHWGVIKTTAIQELRFDETENKQLPRALEPRPRFELQADDILITRAGPRIRCGVACHIPKVRPRLMLCDKAYRFRAVESLVRPEFVATALNAPEVVTAIDKLKTGISESGMNLTQTKFMELEIPCPSLHEQKEILRLVQSLFLLADTVETHLRITSSQIEQLVPTLLSKAFLGKLLRQDLNDEPASVLLDRIREHKQTLEREQTTKKPGKKVGRERMKKITPESLSKYIVELPEKSFSFDELRQKLSGNYEDMKDAIFKLLEKNEIGFTQYFDEKASEIRFTRAGK